MSFALAIGFLVILTTFLKNLEAFFNSVFLAFSLSICLALLALDFDYFYCSHSHLEALEKKLLQQKLQFFEHFYGSVVGLHQKGYSERLIMKQLKMKERWPMRILSRGALSAVNMVRSVLRDEQNKKA